MTLPAQLTNDRTSWLQPTRAGYGAPTECKLQPAAAALDNVTSLQKMYMQSRDETSRVCSLYLGSQAQVTALQAELTAKQQELLTAKRQLAALQRDRQYTKSAELLLYKAGRLIIQYRARLRQATATASGSAANTNLSEWRSNYKGMKAFTAPAAVAAACQACPAASPSAGSCCWDVAVLQPRRAQSVPQQAVAPHQTVQCKGPNHGVAAEDDDNDDDYNVAQPPKPKRCRTFHSTAAAAAVAHDNGDDHLMALSSCQSAIRT
eukprot:jgi/Chrzof1/10471/UNPLg00398.t1